jgi:hypothetical protein
LEANVMMFESCSTANAEAAAEKMADWFGPSQIDQLVRQAVQYCWMALAKERRTTQELENQIHRLVERALKDFREDHEAFGQGARP